MRKSELRRTLRAALRSLGDALQERDEARAEVDRLRAQVAAAWNEAADLIAAKDHRTDLGGDAHSTGWRRALNEAEHDLRQHAALASGNEVQSCGNCDCQFGCEGVEVQP